ncbi:MAG: hypothetical protein ACE5KQ_05305, partial [Thermoplasmata archaeon]
KYLSYAAFFTLLALGFLTGFFSWIILAFVVLFIGLRHPPPLNDITRLDVGRKLAGVGVLALLVLSLHYLPLATIDVSLEAEFRDPADPVDGISQANVTLSNLTAAYTFAVYNTGNVRTDIFLHFGSSIENLQDWDIFFASVDNMEIRGDNATVTLDAKGSAVGTVLIRAPDPQPTRFLDIVAELRDARTGQRADSPTVLALTIRG